MKKLVRNYLKKPGKKTIQKTKGYDIKKFWTIHFLKKTTVKCENFIHILKVHIPTMVLIA